MTKQVVILTKSTKRGGFCVAGIDAHSGEWVRLTSSDEWSHGALTETHMTYEDGTACAILDLVEVELLRANPVPHQPENFLINETKKFRKLGTWTLQQVLQAHPAEDVSFAFVNTEKALNEQQMAEADRSLLLLRTRWLRINHYSDTPGKVKTKATFVLNEADWYRYISVTDPEYYDVPDKTEVKPAYLVISLPDAPFKKGDEDLYYKFIAKIFRNS